MILASNIHLNVVHMIVLIKMGMKISIFGIEV